MLKGSKQARKYSLHNGEFVWNIRILVIRVCFVFRGYPFGVLRANFVSIYFGRAKYLCPGPKDKVFQGKIE